MKLFFIFFSSKSNGATILKGKIIFHGSLSILLSLVKRSLICFFFFISDVHKEFSFPYSIPTKYSTSENLTVLVPRGGNQSPAPPPIPCRTYKSYPLNNKNKHNPDFHQYLNEPSYSRDSSMLDITSQSWQHQPHFHYPTLSAEVDMYDIGSLPKVFHGSVKSRDDDDCSTTTSGSYTIYSEDLLWWYKRFPKIVKVTTLNLKKAIWCWWKDSWRLEIVFSRGTSSCFCALEWHKSFKLVCDMIFFINPCYKKKNWLWKWHISL